MTHKVRSHHFVPSDLLFPPSCCVTMNQPPLPPSGISLHGLAAFISEADLKFVTQETSCSNWAASPPPDRTWPFWSIDLWINTCINPRRSQKGLADDLVSENKSCKGTESDCRGRSLSSWIAGPNSNGSLGRLSFRCDCGKKAGLKLSFTSVKTLNNDRHWLVGGLLCPTSVARSLWYWCWCHYLLLLAKYFFSRIFVWCVNPAQGVVYEMTMKTTISEWKWKVIVPIKF